MPIKLTASMEWFIFKYHPELLALINFGHGEVISQEIWDEYKNWVETSEEAKDYLKGGKYYHTPR